MTTSQMHHNAKIVLIKCTIVISCRIYRHLDYYVTERQNIRKILDSVKSWRHQRNARSVIVQNVQRRCHFQCRKCRYAILTLAWTWKKDHMHKTLNRGLTFKGMIAKCLFKQWGMERYIINYIEVKKTYF